MKFYYKEGEIYKTLSEAKEAAKRFNSKSVTVLDSGGLDWYAIEEEFDTANSISEFVSWFAE